MAAGNNQDFDWAAWDWMREEARIKGNFHEVIMAHPDYPRPEDWSETMESQSSSTI